MPTSVSRAAGLALTKALSKEYAADNVRVNAVLIGMIKSGQNERTWQRSGGDQPLEQFYANGEAAGYPARPGRRSRRGGRPDRLPGLGAGRLHLGVAINLDGGLSAVV